MLLTLRDARGRVEGRVLKEHTRKSRSVIEETLMLAVLATRG